MTHNLHNFAKDNVLRSGLRPVLYNSWEATEFKVSCDEQIKLAKRQRKLELSCLLQMMVGLEKDMELTMDLEIGM